MIQSWKATDDICLQTYSHKPTHTYKHICNSHKSTHRPKIAKELVCFHPKKNYFLKFPPLLKIFKTATAQPTQMTAKATPYKDYNNSTDRTPAGNSTYKKLAVQCHADTFVVNGNLVLRNYIRADWRQLLVAAERYEQ